MKKKNWIIYLVVSAILSSCVLGRFVIYNFADIRDYKKFPSRKLHNDSIKFVFSEKVNGYYPQKISQNDGSEIDFDKFLSKNKTVAFIIIKNDSILYQKYFKGYDKKDIVPSFSMAKSITSILIGCAIDEGLIVSEEEPITKYIPELSKNGLDKVTIKHLLQMTSGIKFNEGYFNPFGDVAAFYYGRQLRKQMMKMKLKTEPGTTFEYISGNTQLLGLVLERALKTKTVTQYLNEKLWKPLGMEYDASWSIDKRKNGIEKTFCCINARALDFAKIGRLYLNKGNWNGKQIVSEAWVNKSTKAENTNGSVRFYQYQWWIPSRNGDFMAEGILGQFIYVNPNKKLIMVRLGKAEGKADWWKTFTRLSSYY